MSFTKQDVFNFEWRRLSCNNNPIYGKLERFQMNNLRKFETMPILYSTEIKANHQVCILRANNFLIEFLA